MTKLQNALTRVLDELERILKKGKSSKFDGRYDGYVKQSLDLIEWSHDSSEHDSKFDKYFVKKTQFSPKIAILAVWWRCLNLTN